MDMKERFVKLLVQDIKLNFKDSENYFVERKLVRKYGNSAKGVYSNLLSLYLISNLFQGFTIKDIENIIENNKKQFKILYAFIKTTPNAIRDLKLNGARIMAESYLFEINKANITL